MHRTLNQAFAIAFPTWASMLPVQTTEESAPNLSAARKCQGLSASAASRLTPARTFGFIGLRFGVRECFGASLFAFGFLGAFSKLVST